MRKQPRRTTKKDGFASRAEAKFAEAMTEYGLAWLYEPEKYPWVPPPKRYIPDFRVTTKTGKSFLIEYKGYLRPEDRTKMKAIRKQYPQLDLRIIFQNAKKPLYKGSPSTYGDWATKNGYKWADKTIPQDWLRERKEKRKR